MNNELSLRTLGDVEQHVKSLTKDYYDDYVPVKSLSFENFNTVRIDGEPHTLDQWLSKGLHFDSEYH